MLGKSRQARFYTEGLSEPVHSEGHCKHSRDRQSMSQFPKLDQDWEIPPLSNGSGLAFKFCTFIAVLVAETSQCEVLYRAYHFSTELFLIRTHGQQCFPIIPEQNIFSSQQIIFIISLSFIASIRTHRQWLGCLLPHLHYKFP